MRKHKPFIGRSFFLLIAWMLLVLGMSGQAWAVAKCQETTSNGKYWEYRDFLIAAGSTKKGLAKGNNNINGDGVNRALDSYLRKAAAWNTQDHVNRIEGLASKLDGLDGASGLVGYVWLEIARKAMTRYNTLSLDNTNKIDIVVWGRINENNVTPNTGEKGFEYKKDERSGHVWATMCFEIRFAGTNANQDPDAKVRYSVKVEVAKCGFKVIPRGSGTGNQEVFVGSYMPWQANKVPTNFRTKLEAVNLLKGETPPSGTCPTAPANGYVTMGAAYFDKDGDGNWVDYSTFGHLFTSNPQACVDMFFDVEPANLPASFDSDSARPNYCLGRCSDPPVANSGM